MSASRNRELYTHPFASSCLKVDVSFPISWTVHPYHLKKCVSFPNSWAVHPLFAFGVCQLLAIVNCTSKSRQNGCRLLEIVNCTPTLSHKVALKWMPAKSSASQLLYVWVIIACARILVRTTVSCVNYNAFCTACQIADLKNSCAAFIVIPYSS